MEVSSSRFAIEQQLYPLIHLQGWETINQGFHFDIHILTILLNVHDILGKTAQIQIQAKNGQVRYITGIIVAGRCLARSDDGFERWQIVLESSLQQLRYQKMPTMLIKLSIVELLRHLLTQVGYPAQSIFFKLIAEDRTLYDWQFPPHRNAYQFLQYLLTQFQLFLVVFDDAHGNSGVLITDHFLQLVAFNQVLTYHVAVGLLEQQTTLPANVVYEWRQVMEQQSSYYVACSNAPLIAHGMQLAVDLSVWQFDSEQKIVITHLEHEISQIQDQHGQGLVYSYRNHFIAQGLTAKYTPKKTQFALPLIWLATVESHYNYAQIDSQGNYQIRYQFETNPYPYTQASPPTAKLGLFAGSTKEVWASGWQAPLQANTCVLVANQSALPSGQMILGTLWQTPNKDIVGLENGEQAIWRSRLHYQLLFNDVPNEAQICLSTENQDGQLLLANHQSSCLMSQSGYCQVEAKYQQHCWAKKNIYEKVAEQKTQLAMNKFVVRSQQGDIQLDAEQNIVLQAQTNIMWRAQGNVKIESASQIHWQCAEGLVWQSQKNCHMQIKGNIYIEAEYGIEIQLAKQAYLLIGNAENGIQFDGSGSITIFGDQLSLLSSENILLKGQLHFHQRQGRVEKNFQALTDI